MFPLARPVMASIDDRWISKVTGQPTPRHGHGARWRVQWRDDQGIKRHRAFARLEDAEELLAELDPAAHDRLPAIERIRDTARLYAAAASAGSRRPAQDTALALQLSRETTYWRLRRARELGLLPPLPARRRRTAPDATAAAIARYLDYLRQCGSSPQTLIDRRRSLYRLQAALPAPLLAATPEMIRAWRAALTVGDRAVIRYVSHARVFYAWAADEGLVGASPVLRVPVPRQPRTLPRPISEADLYAALDAAPPRIRIWLVLAGWAGLRACEIAALRRENVLDTASPPVLYIAENATKGHHERVVPLSPFVLGELARHGLPASGWVFPRHDGKPGPNTAARISQAASGYFGSIGIQASLHQLRHRFGTQMYRVRRDLRTTQEAMGHAHPSTTAGYAAIDQADIADDISALPLPDTGNAALRLHENDGLDSYSWLSIGTR